MAVVSNLDNEMEYDDYQLPIAVDCIIFGFDDEELKLLLIKRDRIPDKGKWALMGGLLKSHETLADAANRVLKLLTGLKEVYLEQIPAFSDPNRDPIRRTISIPHYALINIEQHDRELIRKHSAQWFSINDLPDLAFDHRQMVREAINRLRYKTSIKPIGFELLPDKFSMRQLQKLYEAILDQELDKRNFFKKVNQMDILVKLDEKDMSSSKKGSFLFRFDEIKYREKVANGFSFRF